MPLVGRYYEVLQVIKLKKKTIIFLKTIIFSIEKSSKPKIKKLTKKPAFHLDCHWLKD